MAKRQSIYMPDQMQRFVASFGENTLSGSLATFMARYQAMTAEACPELSLNEWFAICDALKGCGVFLSAGGPDPATMLWAMIADSVGNGLDDKWRIDCRELGERLRVMPTASKIAVWDIAARFWAVDPAGDPAAILASVGAKIKQP